MTNPNNLRLFKHDTWVFLTTPSPFDAIKHLFPNGIPMRDPFPMASANNSTILLWVVDAERLSDSQYNALAQVIAQGCGVTVEEVIEEERDRGGFAIQHRWIANLHGGPECFQRTKELADFLETAPQPPSAEAWEAFIAYQHERWVEGDEVPPPLPNNIEQFDPRLRTPDLQQALLAQQINQIIAQKDYSVMDVLLGKPTVDILNTLDPGSRWTLIDDEDDDDF